MNAQPDTFPPIRSTVLIGLGAIGTLYAAQISRRIPEALRIVADDNRIARYRARPPTLNGHPLDLRYVLSRQPGPPADLILVAVKSVHLADAFAAIAPLLHAQTQILPLLNGITAQDVLAKAYGWPRVLYGYVYCDSSMRNDHAVVQNGINKIVFGEATNTPLSPRVQAVAAFFERAGIAFDIPPDMRAAQWRKYILNIGINQTQGILRKPSRELQENPEAMRLARTLMDEAAAVATALGIPGAGDIPSWAEEVIRSSAPENKTSMLQDVEAGRPPETDLFAETLCRLGRQCGVPTPANEIALQLLRRP